ncbi:hypothetical protein L6164_010647 [Bauhinia variegata]|uniref:Uncharacterized protein n=1 Tax=Bauhinia variegata TaxID=167791 RepID=A0ACB9PNX7_BAUVA|nr:hypothetical protein L6164_010647 [Bauhinia variegata]
MNEWKRSGQIQIPAFGNWDYANELPITQYFECARQAGLIRYGESEGDSYVGDLGFKRPASAPSAIRKNREKQVKENQRQGNRKVCDVTEPPNKPIPISNGKQVHLLRNNTVNDTVPPHRPRPRPPVDQDLYEIPPELLRTTKRKKMLGFISKCLVPAACVS